MNYIKELKAFRDWLLVNDLNTSAIALWHTLMAINNMTGWKERFNAPNSTVEKLTGLSKQGLVDARRKLIENGLIEYEKGKKGKAPIYKIISLVRSVDQYDYQYNDQYQYQSPYQSHDQHLTIPKQKQNKNKTLNKIEEELKSSNPFIFYEQNGFGLLGSHISEKISYWCGELSDDLVLEAMKLAVERSKVNWAYVETILRDYSQKNIKTLEQARGILMAFKQQQKLKKDQPRTVKPIRTEKLPHWFDNESNNNITPLHSKDYDEKKKALEERLKKYRA